MKWLMVPLMLLVARSIASAAPPSRLTMAEAVREAFRSNPGFRAARYDLAAAVTEAARGKPIARPTLNLEAEALLQGPIVTFPRGSEDATVLPDRYSRLGLVLEQPLFGAGTQAAWRRYRALVGASEENLRKAANDLIRDVSKAYLDLLTAREMERVAREGAELAEAHVAMVRRMVEAGLAAARDLPAAEAESAEAREGLIQASDGAMLALGNLNRLLGRPLTDTVEVVYPDTEPAIPASLDEALALASNQRPDLVLLRQQIEAAESGTSLARVQSLPSIAVRASFQQQTPSAFTNSRWYAVGLKLQWPLLDGGKTALDTGEARARLEQLRALLQEAEAGVRLDVQSAWAAVRSAHARLDTVGQQVKAAEKALEISVLRYEQRSAPLLEVTAARLAVTRARAAAVKAKNDLYAALLDCRHACAMDLEVALP